MKIRVLIPLDGTEAAEEAIQYAEKLLDPHSSVTLLNVVEMPGPHTADYASSVLSQAIVADVWGVKAEPRTEEVTGRLQRGLLDQAEHYLRQLAERLAASNIEAAIRVQTNMPPAEAIIEAAKELNIDIIFMTTRERSDLSRRIFGSVASGVISVAPCPVMVIPSAHQREALEDSREVEAHR